MRYQKTINLLENTPNQRSKFRTKYWVEINDDSRGTYNTTSQIKFKTSTSKLSLCNYSDAYIVAKRTITVPNTGTAAAPNNRNKEVVFNDVVMNMYNVIEYNENYSKISEV